MFCFDREARHSAPSPFTIHPTAGWARVNDYNRMAQFGAAAQSGAVAGRIAGHLDLDEALRSHGVMALSVAGYWLPTERREATASVAQRHVRRRGVNHGPQSFIVTSVVAHLPQPEIGDQPRLMCALLAHMQEPPRR